jgi:hypothetical protein
MECHVAMNVCVSQCRLTILAWRLVLKAFSIHGFAFLLLKFVKTLSAFHRRGRQDPGSCDVLVMIRRARFFLLRISDLCEDAALMDTDVDLSSAVDHHTQVFVLSSTVFSSTLVFD